MSKNKSGKQIRITERLVYKDGNFTADPAAPAKLSPPPFNIRKHKLYNTWDNMRRRCDPFNPSHVHRKNYADRGAYVCDEWANDYEAFYAWATNPTFPGRWFDGAHLDKDVKKEGNLVYCPEFCQFVTKAVNLGTRSNIKLYEYMGERLSIPIIAKKTGISPSTLSQRLASGNPNLDPYRAEIGGGRIVRHNEPFTAADIDRVSHLFTKRHGASRIWELDGFALTWHEWAIVSGTSPLLIRTRIRRGMTLREALRTPVKQDGRNGKNIMTS